MCLLGTPTGPGSLRAPESMSLLRKKYRWKPSTWPLGIEVGRRGSVQLPCPSGVTLVCHRKQGRWPGTGVGSPGRGRCRGTGTVGGGLSCCWAAALMSALPAAAEGDPSTLSLHLPGRSWCREGGGSSVPGKPARARSRAWHRLQSACVVTTVGTTIWKSGSPSELLSSH